MIIPIEFRINKYLSLKLEEKGKTNVYVEDELFIDCKRVLISTTLDELTDIFELESVDDMADLSTDNLINTKQIIPSSKISPETEFFVHCSNLQAWSENHYDSHLIHTNIAFPLLRALCAAGDVVAKRVFKEEVIERYMNGNEKNREFLIQGGFMVALTSDEIHDFINSEEELEAIKALEKLIALTHKNSKNRFVLHKNQVRELYLSDISEIPVEIKSFRNLKKLSIDNIDGIPDWIGDLSSLEILEIYGCESFPDSITKVSKLKHLRISAGLIQTLLESIGNLKNLEVLRLDDNDLRTLPDSIGELKNLVELDLDENPNFEKLPESLVTLKNLKRLGLLGVDNLKSYPLSLSLYDLMTEERLVYDVYPELLIRSQSGDVEAQAVLRKEIIKNLNKFGYDTEPEVEYRVFKFFEIGLLTYLNRQDYLDFFSDGGPLSDAEILKELEIQTEAYKYLSIFKEDLLKVDENVFYLNVNVKNISKFVITNIQVLLTSIPRGLIHEPSMILIEALNPDAFESVQFKFKIKDNEDINRNNINGMAIFTDHAGQQHLRFLSHSTV